MTVKVIVYQKLRYLCFLLFRRGLDSICRDFVIDNEFNQNVISDFCIKQHIQVDRSIDILFHVLNFIEIVNEFNNKCSGVCR